MTRRTPSRAPLWLLALLFCAGVAGLAVPGGGRAAPEPGAVGDSRGALSGAALPAPAVRVLPRKAHPAPPPLHLAVQAGAPVPLPCPAGCPASAPSVSSDAAPSFFARFSYRTTGPPLS
jgi:hypothetical protein